MAGNNEEFRIIAPAHLGARVIRRAAELEIDIHLFTMMAWENQLASAEVERANSALVVTSDVVTSDSKINSEASLENSNQAIPQTLERTPESISQWKEQIGSRWYGIRLSDLSEQDKNLNDFGNPSHLDKDKYLWGQFNRFLPIKMTLRALLAIGHGEEVSLDNWQKKVRMNAATWREHLRAQDKKLRIKRGTQLASAFPTEEDKSLNRFIDHFTAVIRGTIGPVDGMAAELGFIEVDAKTKMVKLTKIGYEYVMLWNPVIDVEDETVFPMSEEERTWIKNHLKTHLVKEYKFMVNIMKAIAAGQDTRLELLGETVKLYGPHSGRGWNEDLVSTYQGGALARATALGMIGRRWEYRRVHYMLTDSGLEFIGEA